MLWGLLYSQRSGVCKEQSQHLLFPRSLQVWGVLVLQHSTGNPDGFSTGLGLISTPLCSLWVLLSEQSIPIMFFSQ